MEDSSSFDKEEEEEDMERLDVSLLMNALYLMMENIVTQRLDYLELLMRIFRRSIILITIVYLSKLILARKTRHANKLEEKKKKTS